MLKNCFYCYSFLKPTPPDFFIMSSVQEAEQLSFRACKIGEFSSALSASSLYSTVYYGQLGFLSYFRASSNSKCIYINVQFPPKNAVYRDYDILTTAPRTLTHDLETRLVPEMGKWKPTLLCHSSFQARNSGKTIFNA